MKYKIVNTLFNIIWFNFFLVFFYLSLIEININIFTQIANLTFSSSFAAAGAYFSALFMALEIVLLILLAFKIKEETVKPEWMRDYSYCAPIYLIRTNYKTITKYFWFFSCLKKILIALMITVFYHESNNAILGVASVQLSFLAFSIYCEPFERRHFRIHLYLMELFKLFTFLSLINFSEKYIEYIRMIEMTHILYQILAFIFGFNLFWIIFNIIAERKIFMRYLSGIFQKNNKDNEYVQGRRGYYSEGKLCIYEI